MIKITVYDTTHNYFDYISDTTLDLSQPGDITDLNIVVGELPSTGFSGVVENIDGTIFSRGFVSGRSVKWGRFSFSELVNEQGNYEIRGLIPGEYKLEIHYIFSRKEMKVMTVDSTFSINNVGERKEMNLLFDDKKSRIEDILPRLK